MIKKMTLLRLFNCGRLFSLRNSLFSQPQTDLFINKSQRQRQHVIHLLKPSLGLSNPTPTPCYSTIAKPHMSKSLQKWKKRKRKSKAQQKRELANLQKDFTQLLTKRAVQLMQEDSYHNKNRQVVTTHTYSNDSVIRLGDTTVEALTVQSGIFKDTKVCDVFSERLDSQLQNLKHSKKDICDYKPIQNAKITHLTEFYKEETDKISHTNNGHKYSIPPSINFVQKYLSDKQNDGNTSVPFGQNSNVPLPTLSDVFQDLQKSIASDKKFSHTVTVKSLSGLERNRDHSFTYQDENDLSHQFMKFKEGMSKFADSKRSWESHGEFDNEKTVFLNTSETETADTIAEDKIQFDRIMDCRLSDISTEENVYKDTVLETESEQVIPLVTDRETHKSRKVERPLALQVQNKDRMRELRQEHKDFQDLIDKSFVDACCFTGNELLALRNIEFQSNIHGASSLEIFNRLIHTLAKKENLEAIKSLFSLLRQWNVSPSLQTYAGCLECVGRMKEPDSFLCERLIADIGKAGFDLGEIANSCSFESDEWDCVVKAIRLVKPDFIPNPPPLPSGYSNELLLQLECENPKRLENNQYALDMKKGEIMARLQKQMKIEKAGLVEVQSICAPEKRSNEDIKMNKLRKEIMAGWRKSLCNSFNEKLPTYEKKAQNNVWMTVYPYLKLFPPDVYVDIIFKHMQEMFSEAYSPTQAVCHLSLGHHVNRMYSTESRVKAGMADKMTKLYDQFAEGYLDKNSLLDNHRKLWAAAMTSHYDTINLDSSMKKWPRHVIKMVGKFLLDLILYDLKIDAFLFKPRKQKRLVPAFCTIYRPDVTTFKMPEVKIHPVVSKLFKVETTEKFHFEPNIVPMLVPPIPWMSKNMGGLLLGSYALIRMGNDLNHHDPLKRVNGSRYTAVLDSLNTLSACAWKINKQILDLQIEIFRSNGDPNLKLSPPSSVLPPLPIIKSDMGTQEKVTLYKERLELQQQKRDMHGLWCSDLYRLSIANKFRDETFWFPHSMDFRGRTYPLPPHFNHLGSDNVRGMLLFAKGKPLGPNGHEWLKIHLINLTGFKKRNSNAERLAYADSLMDDIMDSADRPLTGRKWWQTSDEPWQTLACCFELAKIERYEGNKEDYVCHFPVHQDGSCNGLQHYAALGRDQAGSESVNLVPFEAPQDVYSDVVELVERERKKDADDGHELAKALEGFIKRKVIKQTIMTTVYGVTPYGAKAQIHKQLKDIPEFPQDKVWAASFYLTEKTLSSLQERFSATKNIQDWLTEAAHLISAFKPVDWVTPLGFPVVQPYFKHCRHNIKRNKFLAKPNVVKQRNAFPPNYIHSLDSTHMMLTSLYSMHEGITFVSVHDCFWTHACDVPIMNRVCREQFVNMHNQPLLENLSQHLVELVDRASTDPSLTESMKNVNTQTLKSLLNDVPTRGTFDLNDVLKSTYFFS